MLPMHRPTRPSMLTPLGALLLAGLLTTGCSSEDTETTDGAATGDETASDDAETSEDGAVGGAGAQIDIVNVAEAFAPATVTVAAGTEVTWTNTDGINHTTTASDGAWDSGSLASGATFDFAPAEPGTYSYFCAIHPSMTGEIVVEA